jgi:tetratricopeptide (TPR) repeat protein
LISVEEALGRARLYAAAGNHAKATEVLGSALQHNPDDPALLVALARAQLGLGNPVAAAAHAHSALMNTADSADGMRVYAVALDSLGRRDEALTVAHRAVQTSPQDHLTHYTYASLLLNAGHPAHALTAVGEAVRLEPADAHNHFLAGRILEKLRRIPESTAAYQEALRLDPEHADAAHNIAVNEVNRGHWGRALRGFLGAARLDPELGQHVRRNVGVALTRPLRWATLIVVVTGFFAILCHQGTSSVAPHIMTLLSAAALVALLVWVVQLVPASARRSVLRARPMLAVRGGLAGCAVPVALLAVIGVVPTVSLPASVLLLLTAVVVIVAGWLSGT